jgi:hypothetical protein
MSLVELFSVRPLCSLRLCGEQSLIKIHHKDTKKTEVYTEKPEIRMLPHTQYLTLICLGA